MSRARIEAQDKDRRLSRPKGIPFQNSTEVDCLRHWEIYGAMCCTVLTTGFQTLQAWHLSFPELSPPWS